VLDTQDSRFDLVDRVLLAVYASKHFGPRQPITTASPLRSLET
jgi:hypothetical protein